MLKICFIVLSMSVFSLTWFFKRFIVKKREQEQKEENDLECIPGN